MFVKVVQTLAWGTNIGTRMSHRNSDIANSERIGLRQDNALYKHTFHIYIYINNSFFKSIHAYTRIKGKVVKLVDFPNFGYIIA